ncbi:MAG: hypothetical protein HPY76_10885 [Anaerolineae bacterium]|nr:hypothetical protein [Anaerolineae bacterium]
MIPSNHSRDNPSMLFKVVPGVVALALTAAIFTHAYLGSYTRYIADDYCTAGKLTQAGFGEAQVFWYQEWSGRYAFTFFITLIELIGPGALPYLPGILLTGLMASAFVFTNSILKKFRIALPFALQAVVATLAVFLTIYTTPNFRQNLYWMTGAITYLFPIIIFLVLLGMMIRLSGGFAQLPAGSRALTGLVVFLLAWMDSGFSEILTLIQLIIFIIVLFHFRLFRANRSYYLLWVAAFSGTLAGMLIMITAPGNAVRLASLNTHHNVILILANAAKYSLLYSGLWIVKHVNLIWSASTLIIIGSFLARKYFHDPEHHSQHQHRTQTILIFSTLLILIYVSFLPSTWATASAPEDRVLIIPTILLVTLAIYTAITIGDLLYETVTFLGQYRPIMTYILIGIALYFTFAAPLYESWKVLKDKAAVEQYAQAWDEREAEIYKQAGGGRERVRVAALPDNPLGLEDISGDATHWLNVCTAEYYRVDEIITE